MKTLFFQESFLLFVSLIVSGVGVTFIFPQHFKIVLLTIGTIIIFLMYFYRLPKRKCRPTRHLLAVSDGVVKDIVYDPQTKTFKIIVFLNIFDQHQQYLPINGQVISIKYKKGHFHPAFLLEKSQYNERMETIIKETNDQSYIKITQIAGQIARRIVNRLSIGQRVSQGQWLGMIKLSSRVDVEFSSCYYEPNISIGQRIYAKKTILAYRKTDRPS